MEVGVFEAKARLSELLDKAARGQEVIITKRGRAYARLGPAHAKLSPEQAAMLMARVRQRRRTLEPTSWDELKRDRDEGRRF